LNRLLSKLNGHAYTYRLSCAARFDEFIQYTCSRFGRVVIRARYSVLQYSFFLTRYRFFDNLTKSNPTGRSGDQLISVEFPQKDKLRLFFYRATLMQHSAIHVMVRSQSIYLSHEGVVNKWVNRLSRKQRRVYGKLGSGNYSFYHRRSW